MAFDVDAAGIRSRTSRLRRAGSPVVALQVSLIGVGRDATTTAVSDVLSGLPSIEGLPWQIYSTWAGACVWVVNTSRWKSIVEPLVEGLEARGLSGSVTSPGLLELDDFMMVQRRRPTLFCGFRLEVPVTEGPFNEYGVPEFRWGVPAAATNDILTAAARWVLLEDGAAEVAGAGPTLPAHAEDAADLLHQCLPYADQWLELRSLSTTSARYRSVRLETWGQVMQAEVRPGVADVDLAASFIPNVSAFAHALDIAVVGLAEPLLPIWGTLSNGPAWVLNRHLWSSRVPDAHGIQLLTSQHMERATDLSAWKVAKVADERWLVCASELRDWYEPPDDADWSQGRFPSAELVAAARRDFGAMIATERELQQGLR